MPSPGGSCARGPARPRTRPARLAPSGSRTWVRERRRAAGGCVWWATRRRRHFARGAWRAAGVARCSWWLRAGAERGPKHTTSPHTSPHARTSAARTRPSPSGTSPLSAPGGRRHGGLITEVVVRWPVEVQTGGGEGRDGDGAGGGGGGAVEVEAVQAAHVLGGVADVDGLGRHLGGEGLARSGEIAWSCGGAAAWGCGGAAAWRRRGGEVGGGVEVRGR